ncbi:MAG TPA: hypothetical protein VJV78_37165 [Polyangiales bacterium]|nr:hypothetical protein [Polyangiales bacterium]
MRRSDDMSMYDDPNESAFVRELLHAGRRANSDYDVERGLARHLAATASLPVVSAAAKSSLPVWLGYVAMPLAAASVAGVLWMFAASPKPPTATLPAGTPAGLPAPALAAQDPTAADTAQEPELSDGPDVTRQRRSARGASRPAAAHVARSRGNSRAAAEPVAAHEAPAVVGTDSANDQDFVPPSGNPYVSESPANSTASASAEQSARSTSRTERDVVASAAAAEQPEGPAAEDPKPAAKPAAAAKPVVDESRLEREMQMLAVTQRVLASDPQRALRLAQQGEREFPGTMFSAERRQLGLLALVKLGRLDEARRAGRPFLARFPNAPWSERLRRALVTGKVE